MSLETDKPKIYTRSLQEQPFNLAELMHGIPSGLADYYAQKGFCHIVGLVGGIASSFVAYRYSFSGYLYPPGVLADDQWSTVVSLQTQRAILLPSRKPDGKIHDSLSYHSSAKAKIGPAGWWLYTGTLAEALKEFDQRGYQFKLAKFPTKLEEFNCWWDQQRVLPPSEATEGVIIRENLEFAAVVEIISTLP